jgi:hypothetical protein
MAETTNEEKRDELGAKTIYRVTPSIRWFKRPGRPKVLQQYVQIETWLGNLNMGVDYEWRDVPTVDEKKVKVDG